VSTSINISRKEYNSSRTALRWLESHLLKEQNKSYPTTVVHVANDPAAPPDDEQILEITGKGCQ
jgi:hypothetical protein